MPDINPSAGDRIEVTLLPEGSAPVVVLAKIMTYDKSGKWQIELAGTPPMRGLIDVIAYEWSYEVKRWIRRPEIENKLRETRLSPLAKAAMKELQA
jgi:hypothetical protein